MSDQGRLIKVIDFPAEGFAGESMWVEIVDGDENDGVGLLRNSPCFSDLKFGDSVRYAGGTDETKPRFAGRNVVIDEGFQKWSWKELPYHNYAYLEGPGYYVSGVNDLDERPDADKDIMRLIAAAPELLAAVKYMAARLRVARQKCPNDKLTPAGWSGPLADALDTANDAIVKAETGVVTNRKYLASGEIDRK